MAGQLERLAKPFPDRLIHTNPSGGGSYVKHSVVNEKLLAVVGPFSFELVKEIRGHVDGVAPNPQGKSDRAKRGSPVLDDAVVGVVCRLSVDIDGREVRIEEVGDCEQPHNWPHDGARLKDAMSDALKRCAMRIGVTLHLWSGPEFSLYDQLHKQSQPEALGKDSAAEPAGAVSSAPAISQIRLMNLDSRVQVLLAEKAPVMAVAKNWNLPLPLQDCDEKQVDLWEQLCAELEQALEAPFVKADA